MLTRFSSAREAVLSLSNFEFKVECSVGIVVSKFKVCMDEFLLFSWFLVGVLELLGSIKDFSDKKVISPSSR